VSKDIKSWRTRDRIIAATAVTSTLAAGVAIAATHDDGPKASTAPAPSASSTFLELGDGFSAPSRAPAPTPAPPSAPTQAPAPAVEFGGIEPGTTTYVVPPPPRQAGNEDTFVSARAARGQPDFTTVSLNVKNNPLMPQRKVVHDVRKAARLGDLIGWQEIGPARYREAIRNLGPGWNHYMPRHGRYAIPNPISWKQKEWKKLDAGFVRTHGGEAKISPSRYITWVKLQHRETGRVIVRVNTHLVSGAWSKGYRPAKAWRQRMWRKHIRRLENLVDRFERQG
jgi:hypothetical protein